ncbi:saccharopine dehydrogenase NADP-binding domain-containing protein [Asanoa sp. WMMD1127]|uniref:saccharopine dehydrogenase family protein n=1 Tax=Asanoa sp. WMMD1127 TaxID=3016107 RepID=UPI0024171843|nr:saccharopine dehydrogenase NADP-binding domain-containing protein [Asanoa sp. WMMD1127]MDG4827380.1 saccharopine dehydrogenase NADP-binding domain-containing protein [Asanoa sp. WMMD1127]
MPHQRWMIYGANGYTGDLVARLAVSRGARPLLAGRNAAAVKALADELGLEHVVFDLRDGAATRAALGEVDVVAHCAGPFVATAGPMLDACLDTGTHYLDVTGEHPVFEAVLARAADARAAGVVLITGAGFDVVPTDCLANLLHAALPDATALELAFVAPGGMSRGTATTGLAMNARGGWRRIAGTLVPTPIGTPAREVAFPSKVRKVGAVPWGDLVTAHHSTGIGDITVYSRVPAPTLLAKLIRFAPVRALAARAIKRQPPGPSAETRAATKIEVWGEVRNAAGDVRTATLTGPNAYDLTADAVHRAAEHLLAGTGGRGGGAVVAGAHTPGTAFGPDFLTRLDRVTVHAPAKS